MTDRNWLFTKGARKGFLTIRDAAKFHNVSVYTLKNNKHKLTFIGCYTKIKFDAKFLNYKNKFDKKRKFV